jgi:hypothetical protein
MTLRSPPTCQLSCYITFDEWLHHQLPALQHSTSALSSTRAQAPDRNKPISWVDYTEVAPGPGISVCDSCRDFANFGRSTAAPSRIIDLHAKPRASLENKHPSQPVRMTSRRHAFWDFWPGLTPQLSITHRFSFSSQFFTLSSLTCHKSLLFFALASESGFYLFGVWECKRHLSGDF